MHITFPLALVAILALTGCATTTSSTRPDEGVADGPALPASIECLVGTWRLDLDDYSAQSLTYLTELGIPATSLTIDGHLILTVHRDASGAVEFTTSTNLRTDAVVHGQVVTTTEQSSGGSLVTWREGTDELELSDWAWGVEPATAGEGSTPATPFFDPELDGSVEFACSAEALTVHGPGAPLVGLFARD